MRIRQIDSLIFFFREVLSDYSSAPFSSAVTSIVWVSPISLDVTLPFTFGLLHQLVWCTRMHTLFFLCDSHAIKWGFSWGRVSLRDTVQKFGWPESSNWGFRVYLAASERWYDSISKLFSNFVSALFTVPDATVKMGYMLPNTKLYISSQSRREDFM